MVNANVKKELLTALSEKLTDRTGIEKTLEQMLASGIIDERKCTIAVIRKYVNEKIVANMRRGQRAGVMQLIEDASEHFGVSSCHVQNCLYKFKSINL